MALALALALAQALAPTVALLAVLPLALLAVLPLALLAVLALALTLPPDLYRSPSLNPGLLIMSPSFLCQGGSAAPIPPDCS